MQEPGRAETLLYCRLDAILDDADNARY